MMEIPAKELWPETSCEANTLVVSPLGGLTMFVPLPHETRMKLAVKRRAIKRADFFKRQAPNCSKERDLSVK
jgi:hypothetical protein